MSFGNRVMLYLVGSLLLVGGVGSFFVCWWVATFFHLLESELNTPT